MFILQCIFAGIGIVGFIIGCILGFAIDDIRALSVARWIMPISGVVLALATFFGILVIT